MDPLRTIPRFDHLMCRRRVLVNLLPILVYALAERNLPSRDRSSRRTLRLLPAIIDGRCVGRSRLEVQPLDVRKELAFIVDGSGTMVSFLAALGLAMIVFVWV